MAERAFWTFAIAFSTLALILAQRARAHEAPSGWAYPYECCSNQDCASVPADAVKERRGGWHVTVVPGTHPQVPAGAPAVMVFVPVHEARPSPDGEWHICLHPTDKRTLCFFAPPGGV